MSEPYKVIGTFIQRLRVGTPSGSSAGGYAPSSEEQCHVYHVSFTKAALVGWLAILTAVGGVGLWSCIAPLASAIIATGTVVVEGNHKTVQHLDGGVVKAIFVQDGDHVTINQPLLVLDGEKLLEARSTFRLQLANNLLRYARLNAERERAGDISFPEKGSGLALSDFPDLAANQRRLFLARRAALDDKIASFETEGQDAAASLTGLHKQLIAQSTRLQLTETELLNAKELAQDGFGTRQRVLEISRAQADLQSGFAALFAQATEMEHHVERSRIDISRTRAAFSEDVETELQQVDRETPELVEKLFNIEDQLRRSTISAPVSGRVVSAMFHTVGGVILPGMPILDIVPDDDRLLIEAQIKPSDALHLHEGLHVDVRLAGLAGKTFPRLSGQVVMVSADRISDKQRDISFFVVRVALDRDQSESVAKQVLKPGMSMEIMIYRGEQTLFHYLLEPLLMSFAKSLKD